jgi:hypothetical protein
MSDKELGKALLNGETPIDLKEITERVVRRDRRRMLFLGVACVVAWMLVVMLPWATIMPMMAKVVSNQEQINSRSVRSTTVEQSEQWNLMVETVREGTISTFIGSVASMFFAAVCTVSFIILSRRATMRQVNSRLAEISAQLRGLPGISK